MCGESGTVFGILVMAPYLGTGSELSKMIFATLINVSKNSQKNLGESTHPIGSTIWSQMMKQPSLVENETT